MKYSYLKLAKKLRANVLRYEHVAGFGALLYQTTPKLDAGLKAK